MPHFAVRFESQPKETMFPHAHDYHQILVFEHGSGTHILDNVAHAIGDFSIHFIPTGRVHFLRECKPYYRFLFNKDYFETCPIKKNFMEALPFFKQSASGLVLTFENPVFDKIKRLINEIMLEYAERRKEKRRCEIIQTLVHLFLLECDKKGITEPSINPLKSLPILPEIMIKLLETIELNYKKRWKVQQYAASLYISTSQLNRYCQAAFQKSILELVHERMLKEARNLLIHTLASVKEIAWELGFEHVPNFIDFFVKKIGMSPLQFREKST
jgi:AraC family transcriptional regulator, transcriptional activator of pobA